ncbi:MAG: NAD+ synthase [Myxococcota bacterium]|nr:NAD+ synthase [Myxococcota bacterium]
MRVALAQVNPTVGDLAGNRRIVEEAIGKARSARADLVVFSEMALTGYPPMDLLDRDGFVRDQMRELDALAAASSDITVVLGAVVRTPGLTPKEMQNAAVVFSNGQRIGTAAKSLLPTYDVFDERRYFAAAEKRKPLVVPDLDARLGLAICEDTWTPQVDYSIEPVSELAVAGATHIINPSASPWHVGKALERREMLCRVAAEQSLPLVFVNQVGGNDELIFDGGSFVADPQGRIVAALPLFETALTVVDLEENPTPCLPDEIMDPSPVAQLEAGLVLGIRDYFLKQNLPPGAVIGLSGGIDSAVTAHLAVEALGTDRVTGVAMPGPFSSDHSVDDAYALARNLGIEIREVNITPIYEAYRSVFTNLFGSQDDYGLTQQNIQSRIRGAVLMAVSNQESRLVLATGNKSELSVGYCTLYGDTVGGLAVLGDVYKRDVYALARHANAETERIPTGTIDKPPSAELAPDQFDHDDLPDYDLIDSTLEQLIEGERNVGTLEIPPDADREAALNVARRLDRNEYKRRQTPLVLRTSPKAFGTGRRMPIVHRYQ